MDVSNMRIQKPSDPTDIRTHYVQTIYGEDVMSFSDPHITDHHIKAVCVK